MRKYKKPLKIEEQIQYLKDNKRVIFKNESEEESKEYLLINNYINVISPFKYEFFKKDKNGNPIKDKFNNHIYEYDVDFSQYKEEYEKERSKYLELFKKISLFERTFNSIISYNVLLNFDLEDSNKFDEYIDTILESAAKTNLYNLAEKMHMVEEILRFRGKISKYNSPYIFLDRLTLSETITIYRLLPNELKEEVFKKLKSIDYTIGYPNMKQFDEALTRLTKIRNCVYHGNSLTILTRYYDIKNKELRYSTDKKKYESLIKHLLND